MSVHREWWEEIISGEYQNYYDKMYGDRQFFNRINIESACGIATGCNYLYFFAITSSQISFKVFSERTVMESQTISKETPLRKRLRAFSLAA